MVNKDINITIKMHFILKKTWSVVPVKWVSERLQLVGLGKVEGGLLESEGKLWPQVWGECDSPSSERRALLLVEGLCILGIPAWLRSARCSFLHFTSCFSWTKPCFSWTSQLKIAFCSFCFLVYQSPATNLWFPNNHCIKTDSASDLENEWLVTVYF